MATGRPSGSTRRVSHVWIGVPLRVIAYYAVIALAVALAVRWLPPLSLSELLEPRGSTDSGLAGVPGEMRAGLAATIAMVAAAVLTLPVAWVYTLTHERRGFRQSVVHTLLLLPVVVAGVVVLVKNSIPLAFSLAGIVAAVRFRNTLEDSKDAVYIFLATSIGLAAAVMLPVAAVISVVFNIVALTLWYTDFGKATSFEGERAKRRLEATRARMRQTGSFVAMVDNELFENMTPEQLDMVADRAWRRRRRLEKIEPDTGEMQRRDVLLRVRSKSDPEASRIAVEGIFDELLKRWRLGGVVHEAD